MINKINMNNLITNAQKGDKDCLEKLIKVYKPYIIKSARSIYINGYEIEDLIQIGNIALVKAVYKYDVSRKEAFTTYAITTIRNAFNLELRKVITKKWDEKFKCSLNSLNKDGIEFMEILTSDEDLEEDVILREEIVILRKALDKLSEDEREIIQWFYFSGKPLKEFARLKGINPNLASKRKERVLQKLRNYFLEQYQ